MTLSCDLDNIAKWCNDWQLELNIDKCSVMNFFPKKNNANDYTYKIRCKTLSKVETVKYLGVTITNKLTWGTHIHKICGRALKKLGFVKRVVGRSEEKVRER